jgi:hypothetical protein
LRLATQLGLVEKPEVIGVVSSLNHLYAYVDGNPINLADSFGLYSDEVSCIVDCNIKFDWDKKDSFLIFYKVHRGCNFKKFPGVCRYNASKGYDLLLRGDYIQLQNCLEKCKDEDDGICP